MYGYGLLTDAAGFSMNMRSQSKEGLLAPFIGLAFTGGCVASVLFFFPLLWSWRVLMGGVSLTIVLLATPWVLGQLGFHAAYSERDWTWLLVVQFGVLVLGGLGLAALAVVDLRQSRDADGLLLFLWVAGTLVFAVGINWVINARSLLPLAPAAGILLARRLDRLNHKSIFGWSWKQAWPLIPSGVLALAVTAADQQQANVDRETAREFGALLNNHSGTLWLQGHWGFQYYLQELGAHHTDYNDFHFQPGDYLVWPEQHYGLFFDPLDKRWGDIQELELVQKPLFPCLTTINVERGSGFYSHAHGPLPFAFGPQAFARYRILRFAPKGGPSEAPVK